jgi:hypothetical protein
MAKQKKFGLYDTVPNEATAQMLVKDIRTLGYNAKYKLVGSGDRKGDYAVLVKR